VSNAAVGGLLRKHRGDRTLSEVAEALGVSKAYLSDVELGRRSVSSEKLQSLSKVLSLTVLQEAKILRVAGYISRRIEVAVEKSAKLTA
jgi:transcriptional regulator with XRE-family HTH domain